MSRINFINDKNINNASFCDLVRLSIVRADINKVDFVRTYLDGLLDIKTLSSQKIGALAILLSDASYNERKFNVAPNCPLTGYVPTHFCYGLSTLQFLGYLSLVLNTFQHFDIKVDLVIDLLELFKVSLEDFRTRVKNIGKMYTSCSSLQWDGKSRSYERYFSPKWFHTDEMEAPLSEQRKGCVALLDFGEYWKKKRPEKPFDRAYPIIFKKGVLLQNKLNNIYDR